jgi:hypothetical protein
MRQNSWGHAPSSQVPTAHMWSRLNSHRARKTRQIRKIVLSDEEKSSDFFRALHCIFYALDVERQKGAFLNHGI